MYEVKLPKWGQVMEEATIVEWLKTVGDEVAPGDPLVTVETDKALGEVEAEVGGKLDEICIEAGETAELGATLCRIEETLG